MRESEIEKYLVKRVKELGGEVRKIKFLDRRGCPDRLVLLPSSEPWFIELKAPGKKLEKHQKREHKRLSSAGALVKTIDTIDGVNWFLVGR